METSDSKNSYHKIECGNSAAARNFEFVLRQLGATSDKANSFVIVLDQPIGFALQYLETVHQETTIVVTHNPCPEYQLDIWDLQPQVLLAGGYKIKEIINTLERAATGKHYRIPFYETDLTPRERDVLRLCATGLTNKKIAKRLNIAKRTVKNHLSCAFSKLGLKNRGQAILYYWGLWHWLTPEFQSSQE